MNFQRVVDPEVDLRVAKAIVVRVDHDVRRDPGPAEGTRIGVELLSGKRVPARDHHVRGCVDLVEDDGVVAAVLASGRDDDHRRERVHVDRLCPRRLVTAMKIDERGAGAEPDDLHEGIGHAGAAGEGQTKHPRSA